MISMECNIKFDMLRLKNTNFSDDHVMSEIFKKVDLQVNLMLKEYGIEDGESYKLWKMFGIDFNRVNESLDFCGIKGSSVLHVSKELIGKFDLGFKCLDDLIGYVNESCDYEILYCDDYDFLNSCDCLEKLLGMQMIRNNENNDEFRAINGIPGDVVSFLRCKLDMLKGVRTCGIDFDLNYVFSKCVKTCVFIMMNLELGEEEVLMRLRNVGKGKVVLATNIDCNNFEKYCRNEVGKYIIKNMIDYHENSWHVLKKAMEFGFGYNELVNIYLKMKNEISIIYDEVLQIKDIDNVNTDFLKYLFLEIVKNSSLKKIQRLLNSNLLLYTADGFIDLMYDKNITIQLLIHNSSVLNHKGEDIFLNGKIFFSPSNKNKNFHLNNEVCVINIYKSKSFAIFLQKLLQSKYFVIQKKITHGFLKIMRNKIEFSKEEIIKFKSCKAKMYY